MGPWKFPFRRMLMPLMLVLVLALALAACGDGDDTDDAADSPDDATDTDAGDTETEETDDTDETDDAEGAGSGALEGERITFAQGHSPDGGYAQTVMLFESCLEDQLGASVTHEPEPGAGGLVATNATWAAQPDGQRIQVLNGVGTIGAVLAEQDGIEFDLLEFTHLGRLSAEPRVFAVGNHVPYDTLEELMEDAPDDFTFAASGPGGSSYQEAVLIAGALGIPFNAITGFDGTPDSSLAVQNGEVDAIVGTQAIHSDVEAGDLKALGIMFEERHDWLPDTPTIHELDLEGEQLAIADTHLGMAQLGRIVLAPPDMDEELATELTDAFRTCIEDPDLLETAEERGQPVLWGEPELVIESLNAAITDAPESVREALRVDE
jgi:tripartite-type tricarboxylate transporter receptor subunit TctC